MTDIEKAFKRLLVPSYIPHEQYWKYIEKRKERELKEHDLHKQNLDVQDS